MTARTTSPLRVLRAFAALLLVVAGAGSCAARAKPATPEVRKDAQAGWTALARGNERWVALGGSDREARHRHELAEKQAPYAAVLACADSRCAPEIVFQREPGEIFVVRTAGNVADEVALGSLEYAVAKLGTSLVVVLGHERCGAVAATLSGEPTGSPNLDAIVGKIAPAASLATGADDAARCASAVRTNALAVRESLLVRSSVLREAAATGRIEVVVAIHDLESGAVHRIDGTGVR